MKPLYTAVASASSGRDGRAKTDDGKIDLALSVPKGLGGPGGDGTNPEQLFAAGYAACFGGALRVAAAMKKIRVTQATITAHVTLGKTDEGAFRLAVELHGDLPELSRPDAEALMAAAHQICPYSNATRDNIEVKLVVD